MDPLIHFCQFRQKRAKEWPHNQVITCLVSMEPLTSKQSGNKQHNSTGTTFTLTTDLTFALWAKIKLTAVLLDMSKAFDSFQHCSGSKAMKY